MKRLSLLGLLLCQAVTLFAKPLNDFLPSGEMFDATIPSPEAVLGPQLGDRHLSHEQIISYLSVLAASSPQAELVDYGRTHEGRRLVVLIISSRENMQKLDTLKADRDTLKVFQGFSVHGDESSGANASVLYAWYLLASNNPAIQQALQDTVVLIDPVINPDGLNRFSAFVNSQRSLNVVDDPNDWSHREPWPTGRTNHYWFDLNRDWLLLTQPESQSRIKLFQEWQPQVLTDHHEMGPDGSFFFQPGVPSRQNPLIPRRNIELTNELAKFHASALDAIGQTYYRKESFDDFYPGKGSTYPDIQGSVGILFEQATANGGMLKSNNGERSLAQGIKNQFTTAVSTLQGAHANRDGLISHKKSFQDKGLSEAGNKGFLLDLSHRPGLKKELLDFLSAHGIVHRNVATDKVVAGHRYPANQSIYLPLKQAQSVLVQSLFSTQTRFNDNTFYDVSAWHLGMAWGLPWAEVTGSVSTNDQFSTPDLNNRYQKEALAYVFDWHSEKAPAALNYLSGITDQIQVSGEKLNLGGEEFPAGSFLLPVKAIPNEDELFATLSTVTDAFGVRWKPVQGSWAEQGIDLGSPQIKTQKQPKVVMVIGPGIDAYQAGSVWHLFDTQVMLPLVRLPKDQLLKVDLAQYTHVILPSGDYAKWWGDKEMAALKSWVKKGGNLVGIQKASVWLEKNWSKPDQKAKPKEPVPVSPKPYAGYDRDHAEQILGGAIVELKVDLTHPLAFGTHLPSQYALVKGSAVMPASDSPYDTPLLVTPTVRAAGYVSDYWVEKLQNKPMLRAQRIGSGSLITFGFNPTFRAFWRGTQRWLINAVFMSGLIQKTKLESD